VWQPFLFDGMVTFDGGGGVAAAISFNGMVAFDGREECGSHFIQWRGGI